MRDSTVLPDLRMLPIDRLLPHEESDPRRVERISERLRQEGLLKNPPVVAPIPDTPDYVVLDGANRSLAFAALGIPHIVAQLVHYNDPGMDLDTWYHVVAGMDIDVFEASLTSVTGLHLQPCSLPDARQALVARRAAAYIVSADGVRIVRNTAGLLNHDTRLLKNLVQAYKGRANIFRASNDVWEKQAPYYAGITAIVIFPRLSPADIIQAARSGERVPTGITRHIIPNRALNVNIPLEVLAAGWSQELKDAWLAEWLLERMAANAIRFYSESTFSYNE